jgi:hypothetical protein
MGNSGLTSMLKEDNFSGIKLMYGLFRRVPAALNELKQELKVFIISEGEKLIQSESLTNE